MKMLGDEERTEIRTMKIQFPQEISADLGK